MKIGVFDSGVGGMTVLSELRKSLQGMDYVYLGDTAHVPYGSKSPSQIERLSLECMKIFKEKQIDALVVACNTATSWALAAIRDDMRPIPVWGVVEPGIQAALAMMPEDKKSPLLVFATKATVQSQAYTRAFYRSCKAQGASQAELQGLFPIIEQACPLLVPMIEEGWIDHPVLHQTIQEYVAPYSHFEQPGVALLGCTHYPWIQPAFERALPGWKVVHSAWAVARALCESDLLIPHPSAIGRVEWIFTDPAALPVFAQVQMQHSVSD